MRYNSFAKIISFPRMNRYLSACKNNTRKAMTAYRKNLKLSQELFTIISCFEIALRNRVNEHYLYSLGNDWLKDSVLSGGCFSDARLFPTIKKDVNGEVRALGQFYTHDKLVAQLGFGFWRYLFSKHQYKAAGSTLLQIFPSKLTSTPVTQYNHTYVFNRLDEINRLRNRIAHHEPIFFVRGQVNINTVDVRRVYNIMIELFRWMNIDESDMLYGLDHVIKTCNEIDNM